VKSDGTLWSWGNGSHGQLGLGNQFGRGAPDAGRHCNGLAHGHRCFTARARDQDGRHALGLGGDAIARVFIAGAAQFYPRLRSEARSGAASRPQPSTRSEFKPMAPSGLGARDPWASAPARSRARVFRREWATLRLDLRVGRSFHTDAARVDARDHDRRQPLRVGRQPRRSAGHGRRHAARNTDSNRNGIQRSRSRRDRDRGQGRRHALELGIEHMGLARQRRRHRPTGPRPDPRRTCARMGETSRRRSSRI